MVRDAPDAPSATVLRSYGYHRAQVLAALVNGAALIAVSLWIVIEAAQRFLAPVEVKGGLMLTIAGLGLAVNVAAFFLLHGGSRDNLNMRGALLHVVADLAGSVAAIVAAGVIIPHGMGRPSTRFCRSSSACSSCAARGGS